MLIYKLIPSLISESFMNSFALCDRVDFPGPNFNEGQGKSAWSEIVGEP
jgi:hypothetical protein